MVIIIVLKHILRVQYYLMESIKCPNDKMIAPLKATSEKATNELGFSQNYRHPKVTF